MFQHHSKMKHKIFSISKNIFCPSLKCSLSRGFLSKICCLYTHSLHLIQSQNLPFISWFNYFLSFRFIYKTAIRHFLLYGPQASQTQNGQKGTNQSLPKFLLLCYLHKFRCHLPSCPNQKT